MPNEIWVLIMRYLTCADVLTIKFLSKGCYEIVFLNERFSYFKYFAKKLIDCEFYYVKLSIFIETVIKNARGAISESNWLYLNYSLQQLKSDAVISSCLCHLFHCPRSLFAKNDCKLCSRKFVSSLVTKPENFDRFFFKFDHDELLKKYEDISFKGLLPSIFFKSYDELATILSDRKRCLTTCVVSTPSKMSRLFLEVLLRILINSCYEFVAVLPHCEEMFFVERYFKSLDIFLFSIMQKIDFKVFCKIFVENNHNSFNIKIINEKFINYCSQKYAC